MDESKEIVDVVELFIKRVQNLEYVILPEARKIKFELGDRKNTLADWLALCIHDYEQSKADRMPRMFGTAGICLLWIDRALWHGLMRPRKGLVPKLEQCQARCEELEKDNEVLSNQLKNCLEKLKEYKRAEQIFKRSQK